MAITKVTHCGTNAIGMVFEQRETTHVGVVLKVYRRDYRAMSDVYTIATFALVWDGEKPVEVLVNANFECDQSQGTAEVDATEEVLGQYAAFMVAQQRAQEAYRAQLAAARAEEERNRPTRGKKMVVFKGRKVPVGTTGVVAAISQNGYALLKQEHEWQDRKANGVWVDPRNLRAV